MLVSAAGFDTCIADLLCGESIRDPPASVFRERLHFRHALKKVSSHLRRQAQAE